MNIKLLKQLTSACGVSGREDAVRDILMNELSSCGDISVSPMGNLTLHIKGSGKKLLFAAHMDEVGIMVTYIEDSGFLRFTVVGDINPVYLVGTRIKFKNDILGIIEIAEKGDKSEIKVSDLYIDIGAASSTEAVKYVSVGDCGVYCGKLVQHGRFITSKTLDNRTGCYILAEAAKKIAATSHKDIYMVFTVQEEVGHFGAKTAAENINPEYAIAIDATPCNDFDSGVSMKTGDGICIKIKDKSIITHPEANKLIKSAADKLKIRYQPEVISGGGTDACALQLSCGGIKTGSISIPMRYLHTPNETASISDIEDAINLIVKICE